MLSVSIEAARCDKRAQQKRVHAHGLGFRQQD